MKQSYYFDAFGVVVEQSGSVKNSVGYAGYEYDKETGLYYLNSRMYDPVTARFMQEDTYTGDANDPLTLNLYTYCSNEPIMYADPTGHYAILSTDDDGHDVTYVKNPYNDEPGTFNYLGTSSKDADVIQKKITQVEDNKHYTNNVIDSYDRLTEYKRNISFYQRESKTSNIFDVTGGLVNSRPGYLNSLRDSLLNNKVIQNNGKVFDLLLFSYFKGALIDPESIDYLLKLLKSDEKYSKIVNEVETQRNREAISMTLSFTYGIGSVKNGVEFVSGNDYIGGSELGTFGRIFAGAGVVLPFISKLRGLSKLGKIADEGVNVEAKVAGDTQKFWTNATEHNGVNVYQRNDLIDPNLIDDYGRTNLQRMEKGIAPIGSDGKSINLHHMLQTNDSAIAELTQSFHQVNTKTIHINPNTIPSGIDRAGFDVWKKSYWKGRAGDFK